MIHIPREHAARLAQPAADLTELAVARIEQGFAPPREIYDVQNRRQVDWARLPLWARPSDPEMFECHEG